jgi:tRNA dimethylallyltransferase
VRWRAIDRAPVVVNPAKIKLAIIVGPTAVGKSEVAAELALAIGAEIVNADSQQVYRYMDIGTGKPSEAERRRVPHHLIDVVNPDEDFNAAIFRRLATASIDDIRRRGKVAIVCGGTGLYIKALTRGLFAGPAHDPALRAALFDEAERSGRAALYQRLERLDPAAARWIHPNDGHRIVRALEVLELTGKSMSQWQKEHAFADRPYIMLTIALNRERAELYDAINRRCERMIENGLLDEVRQLVARGYRLDLKPLQSVGYRHMGMVLRDERSMNDALDLMKRDTRRLAKRQLTWFRADRDLLWFHPTQTKEMRAALEKFLNEPRV